MKNSKNQKWPILLEYFVRCADFFPLATTISIYLLAIHARLFLGYWPSPYHPDPKSLPILSYYECPIFLFFFCSVFIFIPWIVFFIIRFWFRRPLGLISTILIILPWIILIIDPIIGPLNFFKWYFD